MALDPKVDKLIDSSNRSFLSRTTFPRRSVHVKGVPMIVPISLSFHPNPDINSNLPWQIFGILKVDEEHFQCHIYNRKENHPDCPTPDINGILRLSNPISRPISSFFPRVPLIANLYDVTRKQHLIENKTTSLDYSGYTNYDRVDYKHVQGDNGTLLLKYITYRAAVIAHVDIILKKNAEQDATNALAVAGSITSSWYYDVPDISLHSDHNENECTCISIFNDQNAQVALGKSMELSKSYLAVPAYSLLVLHVDLNVSDYGAISNVLVFPARDHGCFPETIKGPNGLLCDVEVEFCHEFDWDVMDTPDGSETNKDGKDKKIKVDHGTEALSSHTIFSTEKEGPFKGEKLLEVFSVLVVAKNNNDICNIHGKFQVTDVNHENFYIYDKNESSGQMIEGEGTLCLEGPYDISFVLPNIIKVDLKDGDRDFCKGGLTWGDLFLKKKWLDSYICSVIKGQHGYAALHYMIYSAGVQASVELYLISCSHFRFVSGKIAAEHSNFEYHTNFVKEYYRGIIFSRTRESPALLPQEEEPIPILAKYVESGKSSSNGGSKTPKLLKETGIRLPLSKSVVCVPDDNSLVFDLNLSARVETEGSQPQELAFSGRAECVIGHQMCVVFQNGGSQMCLLVDWRASNPEN